MPISTTLIIKESVDLFKFYGWLNLIGASKISVDINDCYANIYFTYKDEERQMSFKNLYKSKDGNWAGESYVDDLKDGDKLTIVSFYQWGKSEEILKKLSLCTSSDSYYEHDDCSGDWVKLNPVEVASEVHNDL